MDNSSFFLALNIIHRLMSELLLYTDTKCMCVYYMTNLNLISCSLAKPSVCVRFVF